MIDRLGVAFRRDETRAKRADSDNQNDEDRMRGNQNPMETQNAKACDDELA